MTLPRATGRLAAAAGWFLVLLATDIAVFVLPFRFPLARPVLSDTWIAGANNQAAALALVLVSLTVAITLWRRLVHGIPSLEAAGQLQRRYLFGTIATAIAWIAILGSSAARIHIAWGDESYFLTQLRTGLVFHQPLYLGFEFAYGPALYLWPAAFIRTLAPVGVSTPAAYLVSLATLQAAGLCLLFYAVQALPLRRSFKTCGFLLIAAGAFNTLLGLNYTVFRFILPLAAVVLLARQKKLAYAIAAAFLGVVATLAVSPELGIAFAAAAIVYAIYSAILSCVRWLAIGVAAMIGALLFAALIGRDYFRTIGSMAHGGYNLLILPVPHILVFLFAIVALAPVAVARALRRHDENSGMILALYVVALGLAPAALGRCDSIHIFLDGIGAWLLAFVALNHTSPRTRTLSIAAIVCVFASTQAHDLGVYRHRFQELRGTIPVDPFGGIDERKLFAAIGDARLSAPLFAPDPVLDDLTRRSQYLPGFYCGWVGVWGAEAEQRVIADMRRTPLALVPFTEPFSSSAEDQRTIALAMRLGFARRAPNEIFARGALLDAELKAHWRPIGIYGSYILFRQNST